VDRTRTGHLERITHNPKRDIMDVYTTMPWPALCEEVAKLRIRRQPTPPAGEQGAERSPGRGSASPEADSKEAESDGGPTTALTTIGYEGRNWVANSWESHVISEQSKVEAPGVECSIAETRLDPCRPVSPELSAAYVALAADPRRVEQALELFRCSTVVRRVEKALEALNGGQMAASRALLEELRTDLHELGQQASATVSDVLDKAPDLGDDRSVLRLRRRTR